MEDFGAVIRQRFVVTVEWSPETDQRITEGDVREAIELMVLELDEDATVETSETMDTGD